MKTLFRFISAFLCCFTVSPAQVQWTDVAPDTTLYPNYVPFGGSGFLDLDLDADGIVDFTAWVISNSGGAYGTSETLFSAKDSNLIAGDTMSPCNNAFMLGNFDSINNSLSFYGGNSFLHFYRYVPSQLHVGHWPPGSTWSDYLAVKFYSTLTNSWQFGWILLDTQTRLPGLIGEYIRIKEYAYSPNPLLAGDGSPTQNLVQHEPSEKQIQAFPVPVNDVLFITTNSFGNQKINIRIFDCALRCCKEISVQAGATISVACNELSAGAYFFEVAGEKRNHIEYGKFIKN